MLACPKGRLTYYSELSDSFPAEYWLYILVQPTLGLDCSLLDLLTFLGKVAQAEVLPPGPFDLNLHTWRDPVAEHPYLGALTHQRVPKEQAQQPFLGVVFLKKLRK